MININLIKGYKSFPNGIQYSLDGNLVLLVGENGSGKSHLCEIITQGNLGGIRGLESKISILDEGGKSFEIDKKNIINKNFQTEPSNGGSDVNFIESVTNILFSFYENGNIDASFSNSIQFYQDILSQEDIQEIKTGDPNLKTKIRSKLRKNLFEIKDLCKNWQNNDFFSSQNLTTIFREYTIKRANFIQTSRGDIQESQSVFKKENPQPWNILNSLFESLGFEYRLKNDYVVDDDDYKQNISLFDKKGNKLNYSVNDLSSGEKQIFSLVVATFNLDNIGNFNKKILILDEYDATLNPSLIDVYFKIVKMFYLDKGHKVIMTSHSTDTIYGAKKVLDNISKFYKIKKLSDENENNINKRIEKIDENENTYASVIYKVFGVYSNDLHNELYGYIQAEKNLNNTLIDDFFTKKGIEYSLSLGTKFDYWQKDNNREDSSYPVTLPTFIRHMIHHPENMNPKNRNNFTIKELKESIDFLFKIKKEIV